MDLDPRSSPARTANGVLPENVPYPHLSWGAVMESNLLTYAEKPWLTYRNERGERTVWSYAVFIDTARRLASLLHANGVRRGDRVVIAGHNHPDTILSYFACWLIGACAVPLNMTEDDNRLTYIIGNCGAVVILCRSTYWKRLREEITMPEEVVLIEVDSETSPDPEFYAAIREQAPYPFPDPLQDMRWDECLIVYTSGTTGNPKGVVLIQQNLFADGYDIAKWHGVGPDQCMMSVLPVHHVNGTVVTHVAPFLVGASVVLQRKFSVGSFFSTIRDEQIHVVSVVPTLLAMLLERNADASGVVEAGFSHIICGAGPLTCELADRFETRYGIPIVHGYGLSETTCYTCFLPADLSAEEHRHWMQDLGFPSIGVPLPCNEMAIHDEQGRTLEAGERGEIVARGTNIMKGYYQNSEANQSSFEWGWFRSGDEGFFTTDESGRPFFFITGRIKELIIRGGVNLAPLEIDEVINCAPGVRSGICVGFENTMYGEEVGALVVRTNAEVTEESIIEYCRGQLPYHKSPKVVLFTDRLPVTSTGKYQRNKVKHLFAEWKDTQFRK